MGVLLNKGFQSTSEGRMRDTAEKQEEFKSFSKLWSDFRGGCTLHGLSHITLQSSCYRGLIWFAALGLSTAYLLYLLHYEWVAYNEHPFMTSSSIKRVSSIQFPAITFCSLSPLNRSKVAADPRDEEYHMAVSRLNFFGNNINWSDPYYRDHDYFRPRTYDDMVNESMNRTSVLKMVFFDKENVFHDVEDTITQYGMCFTWNANGLASTTYTGNSMNFVALLNINTNQSYQSMDSSHGFKVTVHDHKEYAAIEENGFLIPPGRMALATLSKTTHTYLSEPFKAFGDSYCLDTSAADFVNPVHPKPYSINACKQRCDAELMFQQCGCVLLGTKGNYPICSHYQYYQCYFNNSTPGKPVSLGPSSNCNCPQPCVQTTYDVKVSYAVFPTAETGSFLAGKLGIPEEYFKDNFVEMHIYFDYLKIHDVIQVPRYASVKDILSNIGGQMGLLLGASILSLMEITEFVFNCAVLLTKKCWNKLTNLKKIGKVDSKNIS